MSSKPPIRITTWNCCGGPVLARLAALESSSPDLVFLQECTPGAVLASPDELCLRTVNRVKGIAFAAPTGRFAPRPIELNPAASEGSLAVRAEGNTESFHLIGIWAQQAGGYVEDVVKTVAAYSRLFGSGAVVVLGDFNSGVRLSNPQDTSPAHARLVGHLEDLSLVSAYHDWHSLPHGAERHATYFHQRRPDAPWHIDFCFIPKSWAARIVEVTVDDSESWSRESDHRPVTVSLGQSGSAWQSRHFCRPDVHRNRLALLA